MHTKLLKEMALAPAFNSVRNAPELPQDITTRSLSLRLDAGGIPTTLDEKTRSVGVVCSTENPVEVFDRDRWEIVPEVLLMSGCQFPASGQVPLLNTHYRGDVSSVLGSCRGLQVEGDQLTGRAHYSEADEASDNAWKKTKEGHLTDYSIGYRVLEAYYIPAGETQVINGRSFEGPVKIATSWKVRELSTCPIGADEFAKARAATPGQEHKPNNPASKETQTMSEQLRKFLESRGLAKTATEEEAWRYLETLDVRSQDDGTAAEQARAEGARAEQLRITEIRSICERAEMPAEDMDKHITSGSTVEDVRKAAFDHVTKKATDATEGVGFRAQVVVDGRDKFRAAAQDGLMLRAGIAVEKPADGARDLAGFSLREIAREALRVSNQPFGGDPMTMIGRALTTDDFANLLANVANKSLFAGYETAEETYAQWCGIGSVPDFKINSIARASETQDMDEIGEDGEFKYDKMSDAKEQFQIATYGKILRISRQTIINDDLSALTDIPRKHGEAWARKVGDIAYAVLIANSAMGDGKALFHADHGNLGTAAALGEVSLAEAIAKMKLQEDIAGKRRLNINPQFFLAPVALEGSSEIFFNSNQFSGDTKGSTRSNPYAGTRFGRIYDARLDDASSTTWYAAGGKGKTVNVYFLNGQQAPHLETRTGWTTDGVEFKVRGDAGAKAVDWKALFRNAGA